MIKLEVDTHCDSTTFTVNISSLNDINEIKSFLSVDRMFDECVK